MKRLRKELGDGIRFYGCGEYGENFGRPHYHVCLFNRDFPDKKRYGPDAGDKTLYTSELLSSLWPNGGSIVAGVSWDSISYVAGYVCDKITGKDADCHYGGRDPEFGVMSRRPGLGADYLARYGDEVYAHDSVVINGREVKPPRFYDVKSAGKWFQWDDMGLYRDRIEVLKDMRRRVAVASSRGETSRRRRDREVFAIASLDAKKGGSL